ncbi:Arsenical-resistance protein ACR3 [Metarhizium album ARSEF 1941]|uniref:Arsenical-resistance protein ACR3 n=1 Tax=Metarhizium album (strain ARSEF 1941) TaxID=1081103 RepID=A0A0B2WJ30_METAS|nr:Arsenical-resistance protein ACR3 [Metarhizium album ARSEF 1941]KHN93873.1 Arsenical-resistance protein ACR3 [Metarhizium album ARSEF 1941]
MDTEQKESQNSLASDSNLPSTTSARGRHDQPDTGNMSVDADASSRRNVSAFRSLGILDRFLALWIFLAMAIGIMLGNFVPNMGPALQRGKFVGVSVPIVMMYPILCKVRYESLHKLLAHRSIWKQICFSIFVNWILAPFLMLALAWAFLPDKSHLRIGLILVGLGRCIAMVLIWNGLAGGDDEYCAILVAINSLLQMVLFAPLAVFFISIICGDPGTLNISYQIIATSVAVFLGIPLGAAAVTRFLLRATAGDEWFQHVFVRFASPWSLIGLLYTILVLFASQGHQVVHQIVSVLRVAAPLVVYFVLIFLATLSTCRLLGFKFPLLVTQSFTAASNNFELAIAVAVATFGPDSDQALAATVGPLIEVPVLIGLVYTVRCMSNRWGWK